MDRTSDTPKLTRTERRELYKQAFELLDNMNQLLDDAFSKHATAYVKQLLDQSEESDNEFLHVKQVIPIIDVNSTKHKMFNIAEDIEDQLNTARHLSSIVTDCGYNAVLANEHHPGDEHLSGDAIYNTMQIALDAIKKAGSLFEKYRYMHQELPVLEKTFAENISELNEDGRKRLMAAIRQLKEEEEASQPADHKSQPVTLT